MPNVFNPAPDEIMQREGAGFKGAGVGVFAAAGATELGGNVLIVEPGCVPVPYHYHLGIEEAAVVLEGEPHLRTPAGWRRLECGDAVVFARGSEGAHQFANKTDAPVRILLVSNKNVADVVVYPDSDKWMATGKDESAEWGMAKKIFPAGSEVDYFHGEQAPGPEAIPDA
jgi:uncharacterized cupin superfamily protein